MSEEIPSEVLDLVRFMCETWDKIDTFVYESIPERILKYPVVQGTKNQIDLKNIGKQDYKKANLIKAVKWMLENNGKIADEVDWKEDFPHENGNYVNTCMDCGADFQGHKRRLSCKMCTDKYKMGNEK